MTLQTSAAMWWMLVNLLHVSAWIFWGAAWRRQHSGTSVDETCFVAATLWLGTLSCVLHTLAAFGWLYPSFAAVSLLIVDALLCAREIRSIGRPQERETTTPPEFIGRPLDWAGTAVLLAISIQWVLGDLSDGSISGTDAAHYHVPRAVNFALGSSLFDPPATPHLYPMGASVIAAWFILPVGNGLLVDSAALPWFVLLATSLCWLFRQATDSSGLAVVPWFLVLLLLLPIVRISAAFSGDLPFAAAFVALFAHVLSFARFPIHTSTLLIWAVLTGLLLGTKTTGIPAALLLTVLALGVIGVSRRHNRPRMSSSWRTALVMLAWCALVVGTGGVWLIVNWRGYGSPIAPLGLQIGKLIIFPGVPRDALSGYLSVSHDLQEDGAVRTWLFLRRYLHSWAGPWLPLVQCFVPLVLLDAVLVLRRRRETGAATTRLLLVTGGLLSAAVLCWLLIDAPWTSLRWSAGLSLRFVLPVIVLGAFVPLLGIHPLTVPWYRGRHRYVVPVALAIAAIVLTMAWQPPPEEDAGRHLLTLTPLALMAAVVVTSAAAVATISRVDTRVALSAAIVLILVVAIAVGRSIDTRSRSLTMQTAARLNAPLVKPSPAEATSAMIYADARGRNDDSQRRIFVAARFDTPLDFQGPSYDAIVYNARDPDTVQRQLRHAEPGTTSSDYLVASIAEIRTTQGSRMVAYCESRGTLVSLGDAGPYRVWRVSPRAGPAVAH